MTNQLTETMKNLKEQAKKVKSSYKNIYISKKITSVKNNLTAFQKKIVFYAISQLTNQDRDLTAHELAQKDFIINVNEFFELLDFNKKGGNYYEVLKKEIKSLAKTPLEITDKESGLVTEVYWLDSIKYFDKRFLKNSYDINNSAITIKFTHSMSEFLTQLSQYVKYNFLISHSLKSKHSIKIYELLQTRKDTNKVIISVDDFIYSLDLAKTYSVRSQMKKYVLEVAKKELNEKLNLGFEYEFLKENIILKAQKNDDDLVKSIFEKDQIEMLREEDKEFLKNIQQQKKSTNFIPY